MIWFVTHKLFISIFAAVINFAIMKFLVDISFIVVSFLTTSRLGDNLWSSSIIIIVIIVINKLPTIILLN